MQRYNTPRHNGSLEEDLGPHEEFEKRWRVDEKKILVCVKIELFDIDHESRDR